MLRITNVAQKVVKEIQEQKIICNIIPIDAPETPDMEYTVEFEHGIFKLYPDDGLITIDCARRIVIIAPSDYRSLEMI